MRHMTIDGSVENGEDFLASYCSVQRQYRSNSTLELNNSSPTDPTNDHDERSEPDTDIIDESNSYFNINNNSSGNITCNNNYFYSENDYQLHVLFGKSIQTTLFDLKEASYVTDLALDDFEDDQVLNKLPSNLKHLSVRWCKLSGNNSLSFLNDYSHTLQSLRLSSVELKSLRFLSELTSLTFLDLSINPSIQDSEICWLSKLSKLTTLDLDATGITSKVIPMITQAHPNLVCLNLSGTAVDSKGLEEALVLKNLKVISVMSTHCTCPYPLPANKDLIIIGDFMTKQDARDAAQYSSFFSRAVQLRLIFGYYKLVANSRSRPHWPWFVQNILDMAKSSIRNEKLVEMALLFLWGEVCGEAMPEDLLNVAHKPVIASVTTICEHGGINTISKIMEYYVRNHRPNGKNVLLFAIGLLTVASHNNKMSQILMYQTKIVPLVLEAFQTYEKIEPSFQKFVLGVLLQLSANVQCQSQIASQKVLQMCVLDCLNIKEYVRNQISHKFVLALRATAVLFNLSCWRANTSKLLEYGALESIAEILSTNRQSMAELLEASSNFAPLAIGALANLCRKGACSVYAFPRWQKVISLAVESFRDIIKTGQLQHSPPRDIGYAFCSINNWDLARSVVALFVNCLTVEPSWSQKFRDAYINTEIIDLLLQYARIVDAEGHLLLSFLFCLILDGSTISEEEHANLLEQLDQSKMRMKASFPSRFCSYIWKDLCPVQALGHSTQLPGVQQWCSIFLDAGSKTYGWHDLRTYRAPKRALIAAERASEPRPKRKRGANANAQASAPTSAQPPHADTHTDKTVQSVGDVVF
jgi:hypothetical protein